jgi:ribosome biogenesis protein SSF1/2
MLLSQTTRGTVGLRIARHPRGPTLSFQVDAFTLARHVKAAQRRPVEIEEAFEAPPLVVLHGFNSLPPGATERVPGSSSVPLADALKMVMVTIQSMFPPINPGTVKLATCRRVLLVHFNRDSGRIEVRHYVIRAVPVGVSRGLKKLLTAPNKRVPDLRNLEDVSEYLVNGGHAGGGLSSAAPSDSEAEGLGGAAGGRDPAVGRVTLPQDYAGVGNQKAQTSSIKLSEIGPRLSLKLVKIEADLCDGEVLFHSFVRKSEAEAEELRARAGERAALKEQRRQQQEANVARKQAEREAKKQAKEQRKKARQEAALKAAAEGRLAEADDEEDEEEEEGAAVGEDDGEEVVSSEDEADEDDGEDEEEEDEEEEDEEEEEEGEDEWSQGDDVEGEEEEAEEDDEEKEEEEEEVPAPAPAAAPLAGSKRPRPAASAEPTGEAAAESDGSDENATPLPQKQMARRSKDIKQAKKAAAARVEAERALKAQLLQAKQKLAAHKAKKSASGSEAQ